MNGLQQDHRNERCRGNHKCQAHGTTEGYQPTKIGPRQHKLGESLAFHVYYKQCRKPPSAQMVAPTSVPVPVQYVTTCTCLLEITMLCIMCYVQYSDITVSGSEVMITPGSFQDV